MLIRVGGQARPGCLACQEKLFRRVQDYLRKLVENNLPV